MTDGWAHVAAMASPVVDTAGAYPPAHLGIIFRRVEIVFVRLLLGLFFALCILLHWLGPLIASLSHSFFVLTWHVLFFISILLQSADAHFKMTSGSGGNDNEQSAVAPVAADTCGGHTSSMPSVAEAGAMETETGGADNNTQSQFHKN